MNDILILIFLLPPRIRPRSRVRRLVRDSVLSNMELGQRKAVNDAPREQGPV